jgi:N6-adenosine-specific RNA methylase IME4
MQTKFQCIVVDPPWTYRHKVTGQKGRGAATHHYSTLTIDELKKLPVSSCADKNCFLWLWITNPVLAEGWHKELLTAWGFTPQSILTWVKRGIGMGYTLRSATEHCLVARKGKPPVLHHDVPTWFSAPRGKHSEKPEAAYKIIERICGGPYLELFARHTRPGWITIGNEIDGLDVKNSLPLLAQGKYPNEK